MENRSWHLNDAPGRILIHAGKTMRPISGDNSDFFNVLIDNATICGYIPEFEDMPMGAIIGYADIVGFTEECTSDWAQVGHGAEWKWQIENAKLFKEPIPYRGRQGLFNVPEINPDTLPEVYDFPKMKREGKTIEMPVNPDIFNSLDEYEAEQLFLTENNRSIFVDNELEALPTEKVIFINSATGERKEKDLIDIVIEPVCYDDAEEQITFFDPNGKELWLYIVSLVYALNY